MDLLKAVALPAGAVRSEPVHTRPVAIVTDERSTNLVMTWLNEYGVFLALSQGSLAKVNYFWFMSQVFCEINSCFGWGNKKQWSCRTFSDVSITIAQ